MAISPYGINPSTIPMNQYGNGGFLQGKGNPGNSFLQPIGNPFAAPTGQGLPPSGSSDFTGLGNFSGGDVGPIIPGTQLKQQGATTTPSSSNNMTDVLAALAQSITSMQAAGATQYQPSVSVTPVSASMTSTTNPNIGMK